MTTPNATEAPGVIFSPLHTLDFDPPCDVGKGIAQDLPACDAPASWTAKIHNCRGESDHCLLCTPHLEAQRTIFEKASRWADRGGVIICQFCLIRLQPNDLLSEVRPI